VWLIDPVRRSALIDIYRNQNASHISEALLKEMQDQGLVAILSNGVTTLTRKGQLLAYNLAEYSIQMENNCTAFSIIEELNVLPATVVVDIGCGGGQTLSAVANSRPSLVIGIDWELDNLQIAKSVVCKNNVVDGHFNFIQGDGNFIPFKDSSVDYLICRVTLHLLNIRDAIREMARVLRPKGSIYLHAVGLGFFVNQALTSGLRHKLFAIFALLNGTILLLTGRQLTLKCAGHNVRPVFLSSRFLNILKNERIQIIKVEKLHNRFGVTNYIVVGQKY
jgi:SAM-dependent methyltransferase